MECHNPPRRRNDKIQCCRLLSSISCEDPGRVVFQWTVRTNNDGAFGTNRVSLSGIGVEKKRGEEVAQPLTRRVAQKGKGSQKF